MQHRERSCPCARPSPAPTHPLHRLRVAPSPSLCDLPPSQQREAPTHYIRRAKRAPLAHGSAWLWKMPLPNPTPLLLPRRTLLPQPALSPPTAPRRRMSPWRRLHPVTVCSLALPPATSMFLVCTREPTPAQCPPLVALEADSRHPALGRPPRLVVERRTPAARAAHHGPLAHALRALHRDHLPHTPPRWHLAPDRIYPAPASRGCEACLAATVRAPAASQQAVVRHQLSPHRDVPRGKRRDGVPRTASVSAAHR